LFPGLQRVAVTITSTAGDKHGKQLDYPKGDYRNPLTDAELEAKFDALAASCLSSEARRKLRHSVWDLDKLQATSELMALCRADL
ncbi:MAG: MmgE/PrpD family protein, partial [Acidiferrobacterales bacterium]